MMPGSSRSIFLKVVDMRVTIQEVIDQLTGSVPGMENSVDRLLFGDPDVPGRTRKSPWRIGPHGLKDSGSSPPIGRTAQ